MGNSKNKILFLKRKSGQKGNEQNRPKRDFLSLSPVHLYFEIISYLEPKDLLQLSRASRILRQSTLSRRSRHVWARCLSSAGVPSCPEDLTEPKYASLLFDIHCNFCGTVDQSSGVRAHYELRVRLCSRCLDENVMKGGEIVAEFDDELAEVPEIYTLIPHLHDNGIVSSSTPLSSLQEKLFLTEDFRAALDQYEDIGLSNPQLLSSHVKKQQLQRKAIIKHCTLVQEWANLRNPDIKPAAIPANEMESAFIALQRQLNRIDLIQEELVQNAGRHVDDVMSEIEGDPARRSSSSSIVHNTMKSVGF